jgi:uncharacterized hydrophobic protein (TIGR00271 family)
MSREQLVVETGPRPSQAHSGVWGVKNYYTTLEQRAKAGSEITLGYVSMVLAAAVLATAGLLLNSSAAVIGSMCVAPFMSPSRAVCIGGLFGNRRVLLGGLVKQLFGLLIVGAGISFVLTVLLRVSVPGVAVTSEVLIRSMPTELDAVLSVLIALSAGAAASLALTADPHIVETPWGQVIDAVIGVEIAISLIPPAAVIGIGLGLGQPGISRNAFLLLLINVLGLDIVGSMIILTLRGIRVRHLVLEKSIRQTVGTTLDVVPGFISVGSTIDVTLLSETAAKVDIIMRNHWGGEVPTSLAQTISSSIRDATDCRSEITMEVIPLQTYSTL